MMILNDALDQMITDNADAFYDERPYYSDTPKSRCCDAPIMDFYEPGNYGRCSDCKEMTTPAETDTISGLLRVRKETCNVCGTKATGMLEQLERLGWMITRRMRLCPQHRF